MPTSGVFGRFLEKSVEEIKEELPGRSSPPEADRNNADEKLAKQFPDGVTESLPVTGSRVVESRGIPQLLADHTSDGRRCMSSGAISHDAMRRQHHPRKGIQRANRWLAVAPVDENCSQINSFNLLAVGNPYGKLAPAPRTKTVGVVIM